MVCGFKPVSAWSFYLPEKNHFPVNWAESISTIIIIRIKVYTGVQFVRWIGAVKERVSPRFWTVQLHALCFSDGNHPNQGKQIHEYMLLQNGFESEKQRF